MSRTMIKRTVWKVVFKATKKEAIQAKAEALILGKPCGSIYPVKGGFKFKEWHSGPKP